METCNCRQLILSRPRWPSHDLLRTNPLLQTKIKTVKVHRSKLGMSERKLRVMVTLFTKRFDSRSSLQGTKRRPPLIIIWSHPNLQQLGTKLPKESPMLPSMPKRSKRRKFKKSPNIDFWTSKFFLFHHWSFSFRWTFWYVYSMSHRDKKKAR